MRLTPRRRTSDAVNRAYFRGWLIRLRCSLIINRAAALAAQYDPMRLKRMRHRLSDRIRSGGGFSAEKQRRAVNLLDRIDRAITG